MLLDAGKSYKLTEDNICISCGGRNAVYTDMHPSNSIAFETISSVVKLQREYNVRIVYVYPVNKCANIYS